jgi:hypothetical protein
VHCRGWSAWCRPQPSSPVTTNSILVIGQKAVSHLKTVCSRLWCILLIELVIMLMNSSLIEESD